MGIVSLALRAPFAAAGPLFDDTDLTVYRLGVFACVLATAALALVVAGLAQRRRGVSLVAALGLVAVWVFNPITFRAIFWGHPEEIVGGGLIGAAMAVAFLGYWQWAAVALAGAFATKQWAALVFPAIFLLVPAAQRLKFTGVAVGVALLLVAPMYLGNTHRFRQVNQRLTADSAAATPTNIWWQMTEPAKVGYTGAARIPTEFPQKVSHPLVAVLALVLLPLLWYWRRWDLLGLIPIVLLLRCTLDPGTYSYYHAPLVIAIAVFEVIGLTRFPVVAVITSALLQLSTTLAPKLEPGALQAFYLVWTTGLLAYLVVAAIRTGTTARRAVLA